MIDGRGALPPGFGVFRVHSGTRLGKDFLVVGHERPLEGCDVKKILRQAAMAVALVAAVTAAGYQYWERSNSSDMDGWERTTIRTRSPGEQLAETPVISVQYEPVPIARQMEGQTGIIRMTITDKGFEPSQLSAPVGGRVKVHVMNADTRDHNFVVDRYGVVTAPIRPGGETYVEFTAAEKGNWPFVSELSAMERAYQGALRVE